MAEKPPLEKMNNSKKALIVTSLVNLVVMIYMITATVIAYAIRSFSDVAPTQVLLLMTIPAIVAMVVNLVMGILVQKVNKKLLVVIALTCHFAAMMIFFFSHGTSLQVLYVGAVLAGVTQGSANTLCGAILAEYVEPAQRSSYIAKTQIFLNVGGIIWNLIAGPIAAQNGGANWTNAYAIGFVLPFVIAAVIVLYPKEKGMAQDPSAAGMGPMPGAPADVPADGRIPGKVWVIAALFSLFDVFMYAFNLYVSDYYINVLQLGSSAQVGVIQTCMTVAGMVIGMFYAPIYKKLGNKIVPVMFTIVGLGLLVIANVHSTAGFVIGAACCGIGYLPAFSYMMAAVTNITPMKKTGLALAIFNGVSQVFMFLAQYIINAIAGVFCDTADLSAYMFSRYTVSGIACILLAVVALFVFGKDKAAPAPEQH